MMTDPRTDDDKRTCSNCGDEVYCLSIRSWREGCEEEADGQPMTDPRTEAATRALQRQPFDSTDEDDALAALAAADAVDPLRAEPVRCSRDGATFEEHHLTDVGLAEVHPVLSLLADDEKALDFVAEARLAQFRTGVGEAQRPMTRVDLDDQQWADFRARLNDQVGWVLAALRSVGAP